MKGIKYANHRLVFEERQDKFHWILRFFPHRATSTEQIVTEQTEL